MDNFINKYSDPDLVSSMVKNGRHRAFIGGMWDEIGLHQFAFLKTHGLQPRHRVLDVGCGCFRVGVHLAEYLAPGHYYGIDLAQELLDVGHRVELAERGLDARVPVSNLYATDQFDASGFGVAFDVLFAQSVFTHLPINHLKLALIRLAEVAASGARFFATAFLAPDGIEWARPQPIRGLGRPSYPDRDPFHMSPKDIEHCAAGTGWDCRIIGDWGHARGQSMIEFTRTP